MLLLLPISLLGLSTVQSAAITSPLHLMNEAQSPHHSRKSSTAVFDIPVNLNDSLTSSMIDPRFKYDSELDNQILDKESAYLNTLLALADLSTKGWTTNLKWEAQYSHGGVTIRIDASQNPSTLQYRYAIWGLYLAIRTISTNGFRACVLTMYWDPGVGLLRQRLGQVSILRTSSLGIDSSNSTEESLEFALPTQGISPELVLANLTTTTTTTNNNSTSLATEGADTTNLKFDIHFLGNRLDIDAIFHTIYAGVVYLASWPQSKRVDRPGFINDHVSRTFLRWDSSYLTVQPTFEYRYVIAALTRLPVCMYEQRRFEDARFVVYVDEIEVGRGWLYRDGVRGVSGTG